MTDRKSQKIKSFSSYKRKKAIAGYLIALPGYSIYFFFGFIPMVVTILMSFTNYDLYKTMDFIGFENYRILFKDEKFLISLVNTLKYALMTIMPQLVLGLLAAVFLNNKIIGQKFFRVSFYLPNITATAAISMVWLWIYDPSSGILNAAFKTLGLPPQRWLLDMKIALISIVIMSLWKTIGYTMIIYLSGLQQIPRSLYEAARIDGASAVRQFFSITLPMLKPTTFFLFITGTIASFNVFEQVMILTEGGPLNSTTTIIHQLYLRAFSEFKMGYASAMGVVLLFATVIITLLNFKFGNRGQDVELV